MGMFFARCLDSWQTQQRKTKGKRCVEILKATETHLQEMQTKYKMQLAEIEDAIRAGKSMSSATSYEKQTKKAHLLELLRKRKTVRHYLNVAQRRNQQVLHKTMAVEALEVNQMQIDALKTTAKAFQQFSKQNGVEDLSSLEKASDVISDHMEALSDIDSIMAESGKLPLAFDDDDDDDLLKELEEYEMSDDARDRETGGKKKLDFTTVVMPAPPTDLPKNSDKKEEVQEDTNTDTLVAVELNTV